ncbi:S-adenosyl-L-methionine-dependent methyltransferase [Setomelanomma holmii]|uniref:S-adenosyl-L-methionine-dependent methyltransferase n=1 Tax=Setomelanomma holmii TaxID=210430 RepID=A0A9P4H4A7_9PLEO|nr:S-adenosyl-L-methionine-dependent methyltransferase [Setomelanomma holmii]
MASPTRIVELAQAIAADTALVDAYFQANNIPTPSFDIDGPARVAIPPHEKNVAAAHVRVLGATKELHNLILGPMNMLMGMNVTDQLSLHGVYHFNMASAFAPGTEATFEDIAEKCNVSVVDTRRLMRHAMTNHIFREPKPGVVAHTAASKLLATNPLIKEFVGLKVEEEFPAAARTMDAVEKFGFAQDPGQSGWSLANNTSEGLYAHFDSTLPERGRRWDKAMSAFAGMISIDRLLASFDWDSFGTIVDAGGGYGPVSIAIAQRFSKPKFIVQDLPHAILDAESRLDEKLKDRIKFEAHDFLGPQSVKEADVYFFRAIFHNWPDAFCLRILRNQIQALKPGARLIVVDPTLPEPGKLPAYLEKRQRGQDLNMLTYFGARQRTAEDWQEMLREADPSFVMRQALQNVVEGCLVLDIEWMAA